MRRAAGPPSNRRREEVEQSAQKPGPESCRVTLERLMARPEAVGKKWLRSVLDRQILTKTWILTRMFLSFIINKTFRRPSPGREATTLVEKTIPARAVGSSSKHGGLLCS